MADEKIETIEAPKVLNPKEIRIAELEKVMARFRAIPDEVMHLVSFVWDSGSTMDLVPIGDEDGKDGRTARKIRGILEGLGYAMTVVKKTGNHGDEEMVLQFKVGDVLMQVDSYMPSTCKKVTKTITKPAEKRKVIPAKPAETIEITTIECDGLPSMELSRKTLGSNDPAKDQVERDLDQAELDSPGSTQ